MCGYTQLNCEAERNILFDIPYIIGDWIGGCFGDKSCRILTRNPDHYFQDDTGIDNMQPEEEQTEKLSP